MPNLTFERDWLRQPLNLTLGFLTDMAHEFDGKKYEAASAHQKEWGARLIQELSISGTERILDLGCGDGTLTAQLAALTPRGSVVGIDGRCAK